MSTIARMRWETHGSLAMLAAVVSVVVCAECRASVPAVQVEMTGLGWRCRACSLRHQIDIHQGADEGVGQIGLEDMRARASNAINLCWLTIFASVLVTILLITGVLPRRIATRAFWIVPAGLVFAGYEFITWRKARRAVDVMIAREAEDPATSNRPVRP